MENNELEQLAIKEGMNLKLVLEYQAMEKSEVKTFCNNLFWALRLKVSADDYDFIIDNSRSLISPEKYLIICGQKICCSCNSTWATKMEVLGWAFSQFEEDFSGKISKQSFKNLKKYWVKEGKKHD